MRGWILLVLLAAPLGGCFYSLDGSLVGKKRDAGADVTLSDGSSEAQGGEAIPDAPTGEAIPDAPTGEALATDAAGEATDLTTEGLAQEAGADAALVDAQATE